MGNLTLQLKDGFSSESPDLRDDVQRLQPALIRAGFGAARYPIERKDWRAVADIVGNMQQNHSLGGIRKRRRMEGDLIRRELGF